MQDGRVPTNQDVAAVEPLQTKGEAKKLMPKEPLYFPFQCRLFYRRCTQRYLGYLKNCAA